ncbi:hypothetical protein ACIRBX_36745 [Kitasatospora sp. NPDC096147]|uniref:hypothetical protein n=1 Tax=Kitasatospora sp. NPDC096147 TaxID=3364093 RepID=UPI00382CAC60
METTTPLDWLVSAADDPVACRAEWEAGGRGVMLLPAGRRWDVLLVPGPLGRAGYRVLSEASAHGPVFADFGDARVGFLVPVGTAARWIATGVRGAGHGTRVALPHPAGGGRGLRWLTPPDGSGRLTDPVLLELALHEAAALVRQPPGA